MINMNLNRNEIIEKIKDEISCVKKLTDLRYQEIIGTDRLNELKRMLRKLTALESKLENNTFEISIVGLEKSGKSTFANAFMGIDILPTKDARCTYTATSICYGSDDKAEVKFYSNEEFNEGFFAKIKLIETDISAYPLEWYDWTKEILNEAISSSTKLSSEQKNIYNDIVEIIENKESLYSLLGKISLEFSGDELDIDVKEYIEDPAKALAVKEIIIRSTKLSAMKNAVLYDVPGFDSPTQLHKEQTRSWMKKSDAVILIVNADRPSFNDSLVQFFETVDKDDDGIPIGEKLFVFANRADIATTLSENINKIKDELIKYEIMPSKIIDNRVLAGSAKAKLDIESGVGNSILEELEKRGLADDGIDTIRNILTEYNDTIRVQVMHRRINNIRQAIINLLVEIQSENQIQDDITIDIQLENMIDDLKRESKQRINDELSEYRDKIEIQSKVNKSITSKVRDNVISKIDPDQYQITDEEIRRAKNTELIDSKTVIISEYKVRQAKFAKMYNEFIDNVVDLAVEEYHESERAMVEAFLKGLEITPTNPYFDELETAIKLYISENCRKTAPEGYYSSLIRRYSRNLFEILISAPFSEESRYRIFDEERKNFYSLSLFGSTDDTQIKPSNQPMHYQILFHEQLENIDNGRKMTTELENAILLSEKKIGEVIPAQSELYDLLDKFIEVYDKDAESQLKAILGEIIIQPTSDDETGIPLFAINPNPIRIQLVEMLKDRIANVTHLESLSILTEEKYKDYFRNYKKELSSIKDEFRTDIFILKNILNTQVMNAISIEIPFLDLVQQNVISLKESLEKSDFTTFINQNKSLILDEKYRALNDANEKRKRQSEILSEIENIVYVKE